MTALGLIITDAGRAAMVDQPTGGTKAVRIAAVGLSAASVLAAPTLTALPGEFKRVATVSGTATDASTVHLTVRDASTDAYQVRAIALYLADDTLFGIYAQPDPILGKASVSTFYLAVDLKVVAGTAALITFGDTTFLNPPASEAAPGVVRFATAAEALAKLVADKAMTPKTMGQVLASYVATAQLGVAGGIATLGADGKLASGQRPPIDTIDVFPVAGQAQMLALAATPGDIAVWTDGSGRVFMLQQTPANTAANWIDLNTPAPVSSVNGKVGTIALTAGDVGAAPRTRQILGGGLLDGQGGPLTGDVTFTLYPASPAEALAGQDAAKPLVAASLTSLLAALAAKVPNARKVTGGGLVRDGGDLTVDRVLSVLAATAGQVAAGLADDVAVTPAGLAGMPKSLTPNGYIVLPGGLILQWVALRQIITEEVAVSITWPITFPTAALVGAATGWLSAPSIFRDLWSQLVAPGRTGCRIQFQRDADQRDERVDGVDVLMLGY